MAHKKPLDFILPLLPEAHTHIETELLNQELKTEETATTQLTEPSFIRKFNPAARSYNIAKASTTCSACLYT